MLRRERFFECTVAQGSQEARLLVRAWSAAEAERSVREQLQAAGGAVPLKVTVAALLPRVESAADLIV